MSAPSNISQNIGLGIAAMGQAPATPTERGGPEMTHVEIRRVQNGFVVAAINANLHETYMGHQDPQRSTFIAKDTAELSAILEWMITGNELKWLPTIDMPVFDNLVRRPGLNPDDVKKVVQETMAELAPRPFIVPNDQLAHGQVFGGPLNTGPYVPRR